MSGPTVRVLVVDDHDDVADTLAETLRSLGGFEIVGVAGAAADAAMLARAASPHIALVDVGIASGGGEEATRGILAASPDTRVIAHSAASDRDAVLDMLRAGATGYIVKGTAPERIGSLLAGAASEEATLDRVVTRATLAEQERGRRRARIEGVLRGEGVSVVFQPIVELDGGRVVGHEALARFEALPERGPSPWFEDAWAVGLGLELELLAVRLACEGAADLPGGSYLSINVSPATAESPDLPALLDLAPAEEIVLEVTEHARVDDYARFRRAISRVREHGARLAVDDAGAGFASLRHILELDAELIKLDGSLTHSLDSDPRRRSLASALIEFARETGAGVLAEGVESEAQLAELRRLGIPYGQGFHLGHPE